MAQKIFAWVPSFKSMPSPIRRTRCVQTQYCQFRLNLKETPGEGEAADMGGKGGSRGTGDQLPQEEEQTDENVQTALWEAIHVSPINTSSHKKKNTRYCIRLTCCCTRYAVRHNPTGLVVHLGRFHHPSDHDHEHRWPWSRIHSAPKIYHCVICRRKLCTIVLWIVYFCTEINERF